MTKTRFYAIGYDLMTERGICDWTLGTHNKKMSCGTCSFNDKKISLSSHFLRLNSDDVIINTIKHEIAHVLAGQGVGHGVVWKSICRLVGCVPSRLNDIAIMPKGKWLYRCTTCEKEYTFHRKPKRRKGCGVCCENYAGGKFDERFVLELKK